MEILGYAAIAIKDIDVTSSHRTEIKTKEDKAFIELVESIKLNGLIQPITVYDELGIGNYVLMYGRRRLEACKVLGKTEIDAIIIDLPNNSDELVFLENQKHKKYTVNEQAIYVNYLLEKENKDAVTGKITKYSQAEIAEKLGYSEAYVSSLVSYIKTPKKMKDLYEKKNITDLGTIYELNKAYKFSVKNKIERALFDLIDTESEAITRSTARNILSKIKKGNENILSIYTEVEHSPEYSIDFILTINGINQKICSKNYESIEEVDKLIAALINTASIY